MAASGTTLGADVATTDLAPMRGQIGHRPGPETEAGSALDTPASGAMVDHFRVLRALGRGGMGSVLLARDTRLGRLTALKLLRADRFDEIRAAALLDEARLTARLAHPHVVTIHHIGRWGACPYLALEYLDGTTLRQRMRDGAMAEREVVRLGVAIASALAAAHAAGITHRDLKPENVMLPRDGRLRVVDFGVAAVSERIERDASAQRPSNVAGTPGYMAPEQWQGQPSASSVDVYALGVLLYELLAGHRPYEGPDTDARPLYLRVLDTGTRPPPLSAELAGLSTLIFEMLSQRADDRPTAQQVHDRLEAILLGPQLPARTGGPFRGLMPFEEHDARWFFGREGEIDALVERLRATTVLPLVGPSGAGKSSLVRAGLVPRLRELGPVKVLMFRPGSRPLEALAARLLNGGARAGVAEAAASGRDYARELAARLAAEPRAANLLLHEIADAGGERVVLIVDQLEEIITHARDPAESVAFLDAIAEAADEVDDAVRVIFTVRDDFLGRVAITPAMRRVLRDIFVVRRLDADGLRRAIVAPLEGAGYRLDDPALADAMVAEVAGEPSALPLVQFACAELWDRRDVGERLIRRADYEIIGGVAGALARNAESVLAGMAPDSVEIARRLLLRLVGPEGARRVVDREATLEAIAANAHSTEAAVDVLERLTVGRLVNTRRDNDGDRARVVLELAHESLARTWPQLARWLDESSDEHLALNEIEAAAQLWHRRGRQPDELWQADAVRDVRRRLRQSASALVEPAQSFLAASERRADLARRRRIQMWTGAGAVLFIVAAVSLLLAARFAEQERAAVALAERLEVQRVAATEAAAAMATAAADMGLVRVELDFFDWDDDALAARPAAAPASLGVEVWEVDPDVPFRAAHRRDAQWLRVGPFHADAATLAFDLETRAGSAVLRLLRSGCGPVDVPLRQMPGYAARSAREHAQEPAPVWRVPVPSCAATQAGTVAIPAGVHIEGGPGVPPIKARVADLPERRVELPAYRIDLTEVSNAHWQIFAAAHAVTGVPDPDYPDEASTPYAGDPSHPVTGIDAYAAEAFCRWMGRRLPSSEEWTKAGRGGLQLADGTPNPSPRRNLPWAGASADIDALTQRANLRDTRDQWTTSAPVKAMPDGRGPYGAWGFGGNVSEWTSSDAPGHRGRSLRVVRDSEWAFSVEDGMFSLSINNGRHPRYIMFTLGFRCATDAPLAEAGGAE